MRHGWSTLRGGGLALLGWGSVAWGSPQVEPDNLPVPPTPLVAQSQTLELPVIPNFELPRTAGGVHEVRELRVRRRGLLGAELTVRGYVTSTYDCAQALARPGVPANETRRLIDDNPQLCERPKFYLGAGPHSPPEAALWVVDVPRPANQRERIALSPAQLAARPAAPRLAIGDLVAVTGTFALQSPHGEQNSDGLLVYGNLEHLKPGAHSAPAIAPMPPAEPPEPPLAVGRPMRLVVPVQNRNDSIDGYERCDRALNDHKLDLAIMECRGALDVWKGNHLAWYALGNALAARADWRRARDAYDQAVQLRPDAAMYQLYDGIASYEVAMRQASDDQARPLPHAPALDTAMRSSSTPEAGAALRSNTQDPTTSNLVFKPYQLAFALAEATASTSSVFDRARRPLAIAVRLAPGLWLASYYLGRTELELDRARPAAEAFTASIRADPSQADPNVALLQLYRAWDFSDQGLAVARQASVHITAGNVASAWYEVGMAYDAKRQDAAAIAAFGRAIAAGDPARAKFQRGQVYFRAGDFANARRDLEAFLASRPPQLATQISRSLLVAIARKLSDDTYLRNGGQMVTQ